MNRISIPCNKSNYGGTRSLTSIKYIVIHYTANNGDTAKNNGDYFKNNVLKSPASAHYFVDETTICQSVQDNVIAYHCGATKYYHQSCRNTNSIGVEMVSRKDSSGNFYIKEEVIQNTVLFVKELMDKYKIPISNIVRHYDVTHKSCPEPFVRNESLWKDFLNRLEEENVNIQEQSIKTPNGIKKVSCINYQDTNYVKLRDIEQLAPLSVSFSNNTISVSPKVENKQIKIDSDKKKVDTINLFDTNYIQLRSIASALGYSVDFNSSTGDITLKKE